MANSPQTNSKQTLYSHISRWHVFDLQPPHASCVRRPTSIASSPCFPLIGPCVCPTQIDNEEYGEALSLAHAYNLDSDLVYQRQWRKSTVSIASIQDYLVRRRTTGERWARGDESRRGGRVAERRGEDEVLHQFWCLSRYIRCRRMCARVTEEGYSPLRVHRGPLTLFHASFLPICSTFPHSSHPPPVILYLILFHRFY